MKNWKIQSSIQYFWIQLPVSSGLTIHVLSLTTWSFLDPFIVEHFLEISDVLSCGALFYASFLILCHRWPLLWFSLTVAYFAHFLKKTGFSSFLSDGSTVCLIFVSRSGWKTLYCSLQGNRQPVFCHCTSNIEPPSVHVLHVRGCPVYTAM